jgi:hypothetical protein
MSKVQLLIRFLRGWHGEYITEYNTCGSITYYSNDLDYCLKDAVEGCVIIDKSECGDDGVSFVINGPMVNLELPENTVKRFSGHEAAAFMLPGLGGDFQSLAAKAVQDREWSGLDYISLDLYVAAWKGLGAKIGYYRNGKVEWDNVR